MFVEVGSGSSTSGLIRKGKAKVIKPKGYLKNTVDVKDIYQQYQENRKKALESPIQEEIKKVVHSLYANNLRRKAKLDQIGGSEVKKNKKPRKLKTKSLNKNTKKRKVVSKPKSKPKPKTRF